MSTEEIQRMLSDAYSYGMTDYVVWGGEPLLREDLPRILSFSDSIGLDTTVITNGSKLTEKIDSIGEYLYGLIVSIDHPDPTVHDSIRKKKGIYHKAIQGIKDAKKYSDLDIFINCVISRRNFHQLREITELASELDVKISFEMMELIEGYNEGLSLSREEVSEACRELIDLKREGYPIVNSEAYFESVADEEEYSCHVPKILVTVEWDGEVRLCSTISEDVRPDLEVGSLGNLREDSFREIFESENYEKYVDAAEKCWKCDLSYPRESAHLYSLDKKALKNFFGRIMG